jgi:hypothetical protein
MKEARCPLIATKEHAMTEERIVRAESPEGNTHTSTTIITDRPDPDSGISSWFVLFVVLLAVLIGIWAFTSMSNSDAAEDQMMDNAAEQLDAAAGAVGDAADQVGDAAGEVRDAASDVGDAAADTVDDAADTVVVETEPAEPAE